MSEEGYTIAVRELCEFTAKEGDLDLRFTPAPTAQEGIAGHALVIGRRGEGYRAEVVLEGRHGPLRVRGRADGFDPAHGRLEEIKTHKGSLERMPDSRRRLHWAQAKIYGWLLCQQECLAELELCLVYLDIGSQRETAIAELYTAEELRAHFERHCEAFLEWAQHQLVHRAERDHALAALRFPFADFRDGQRRLAEAVYKAAVGARCLVAQAPTGIGKTLGTLFPLLKATPAQRLDKIFFLAAKTSGRQLALKALRQLNVAPLRVLELVAREKACKHPDKACHGESCPLARGFYNRLPAARAAAVAEPTHALDQMKLREVALRHDVCPYYLSQEMARWADVIVGDYNYYFDSGGLLHGLMQANQWRIGLLVDEAHNLVERGRMMFTAELRPVGLALARRSQRVKVAPALKRVLDKLRRAWIALDAEQDEDYRVYPALPDRLHQALQQCNVAIQEHLAEHAAEPDPEVMDFGFEALRLLKLAESLGTHSLVDVMKPAAGAKTANRGGSLICIRNVVPAPFLRPRLEAAHTSCLFSATLQPSDYYADLLGLPDRHARVDIPSPFSPEQLRVSIAGDISTRFSDRQASLAPTATLMAAQFDARPGNYLAFFSSYQYLQQVADLLVARHPGVPIWCQSPRMGEAGQQQFLERFVENGRGIGFAVLGGAFSEGIDLPGRRLIGAFVSTLGLPQINPVNEQIRLRMEALFGAGYDYTYLYPGLQKVVQAAGRVIRTPNDEGVIHLIDDRYKRTEVRRLLPGWWQQS